MPLEVPAEPFVDCTAEELAWMYEEAPYDPEGEALQEATRQEAIEWQEAVEFQYFNCPTAPPRGDCRMMQWWFRWLRPFTGPAPPSRWAVMH